MESMRLVSRAKVKAKATEIVTAVVRRATSRENVRTSQRAKARAKEVSKDNVKIAERDGSPCKGMPQKRRRLQRKRPKTMEQMQFQRKM